MKKQTSFVVEVVEEKPKCLVVFDRRNRFVSRFIERISQTHLVYESSPNDLEWSKFDTVALLGVVPDDWRSLKGVRLVYAVYFNQISLFKEAQKECVFHLKNYKLINLGLSKKTVSELVDYLIYQTPTPYVFDFGHKLPPKPFIKLADSPRANILLALKMVIGGILLANLLALTAFLAQVGLLWWLMRSSLNNPSLLRQQTMVLNKTLEINRTLRQVPANTLFWVPGIDGWLNLVDTTNNTAQTIVLGSEMLEGVGRFTKLLPQKHKNAAEVAEIKLRLEHLDRQFANFTTSYYTTFAAWEKINLPFVNARKQHLLDQFKETEEYLQFGEQVLDQLPQLLGAKKARNYLLLFMNNMELRPGGGFIGSVATIRFNNYSLEEFRVYDVYTLDGQLRTHIDPPAPIRQYLHQPHWFLRDSNFSPDFSVNAQEALRFVRRSVKWEGYDGVIGVTLSSVQEVLGLFPDFYLPDYQTSVNADNFFLKAQAESEKGFFPGSHQKRDFLQSVLETLVLKLEEGDFDIWRLGMILRTTLEEKQLVVYFTDPQIQATYDQLFWTGRVVKPECNFSEQCFADYLQIVDANLGVNKSNFFVQRTIRLVSTVTNSRQVVNSVSLDYFNESIPGVFPGGNYQNYLQIYFPKPTLLEEVKVDGQSVQNYDLATELNLRKVGLMVKIAPGEHRTVLIRYRFENPLANNQQYQLIVQKQVGSINNDFVFEMQLPPGINLKQANFTPVVRAKSFVYNTFLQKDRILVVDFK